MLLSLFAGGLLAQAEIKETAAPAWMASYRFVAPPDLLGDGANPHFSHLIS
jgi:hypothetical protein